jgi:ParB-like chromosome segregation protein Spo0J
MTRPLMRTTVLIPIDLIDLPSWKQRSQDADLVRNLGQAITTDTLLQGIGVLAKPDGRFSLIWGRNRLDSCRAIGAKEIEAKILEGFTEEEARGAHLVGHLACPWP